MSRFLLLWLTTILAGAAAVGCQPAAPVAGPTMAASASQSASPPVGPQATPTAAGQPTETPTPPLPTPIVATDSPAPSPVSEQPPTAAAPIEPLPTDAPTATPDPTATPEPACMTPGRIVTGSLDSAVAGEPMTYRVYLPPCYGEDGRVYPALYMFGGNIHDDRVWDDLGLDEAAEAAIAAGSIPPLILVMPDNGWLANSTTSGPRSYEGFVIAELIPHIEAAYCGWADRAGRAVGGLSRGGYWSLMMAFRRADLFRSVGGHSPALIDSYAGPAEDPKQTAATNDLTDLRIWVDLGERDPYLVEARPLHDALTNRGIPHEWRIYPGTHEDAYWREHTADYLAWYSDGWRVERAMLPACATPPIP